MKSFLNKILISSLSFVLVVYSQPTSNNSAVDAPKSDTPSTLSTPARNIAFDSNCLTSKSQANAPQGSIYTRHHRKPTPLAQPDFQELRNNENKKRDKSIGWKERIKKFLFM